MANNNQNNENKCNLMTVKEVAETLGVSAQTVKNMIAAGDFCGVKIANLNHSEVHPEWRIERASFGRYMSSIWLPISKKQIETDKIIEECEEKKKAIETEIKSLEVKAELLKAITNPDYLFALQSMAEALGERDHKEYQELQDLLNGETLGYEAHTRALRQAGRIARLPRLQRIDKAIDEAEIKRLKSVVEALQEENESLRKLLTEKDDEPVTDSQAELKGIAKTINLIDCGFSIRVLNTFRNCQIYTLYDLLLIPEKDLRKFRNVGKHQIDEIKDWLEGKKMETPIHVPLELGMFADN